MDTGNPVPVQNPSDYQNLGKKTFWLFFATNVQGSALLLLIAIGLFVLQGQPFLQKTPTGDISGYILLAAWCALGLFALALLLAYLISWLTYKNYRFMLDDDSLKISRGVFEKEEVAIPYRQIQDVDIERNFTYQLLGMSRVVILTAGHEDHPNPEGESEGIIPAMDKPLAEWLQSELLKKTGVQKVSEVSNK